jgi:hypothetical protein
LPPFGKGTIWLVAEALQWRVAREAQSALAATQS